METDANRQAGVDAANRQEQLETAANRQAGVDAATPEGGGRRRQPGWRRG